jgi:ribonuclease BN (tRNA processing enzyme)
VVLREAGYCVRATTLDHGTPVLAYAYEPEQQLNIRKDRLLARGFAPGPWLGTLKERVLAGDGAARIALPNGQETTVDEAAEELVLATPGKRLVYATDFADTADNRERVIAFARFAHTLFCEATFVEADRDQARRTGHLTTRACGEIANAAHVARLVPFHFSRRYAHDAQRVYAEIAAVCSATCVPRAMTGESAECDLAD